MMRSKSLKLYNCKINNVPTTIYKDGAIIFDSIRNWIQKSHTSSTFQVKFSFLNNSSQEKEEITIFKILNTINVGSFQKTNDIQDFQGITMHSVPESLYSFTFSQISVFYNRKFKKNLWNCWVYY